MPAERPYILNVVKSGLIESPETKYEKEYTLTKNGKWLRDVANLIFPRRYFLFVLRNELSIIRVKAFKEN
jgi:hypothetical protein